MKYFYWGLLLVVSLLGTAVNVNAQSGHFIRNDCDELTAVEASTLCLQITTTVDRNAGYQYVFRDGVWVLAGGGAALDIAYDNTLAGSEAANVQNALDELFQNQGSSAEVDTLATVCARGCSITSAVSSATAVKIGGSTRSWYLFDDSVDGLQFMCFITTLNNCDYYRLLNAGKSWGLKDSSNNIFLKITESTGGLSWPLVSKRPKKSVYIDADFTRQSGNCTLADATIPASGYPRGYVTCVDTTGDEVLFGLTMRDGWDGGTVTLKAVAINTNAGPTGTLTLAVNGHCTPDGVARSILNTTGSQNISFTSWAAQNAEEHVTSPAITLQGTCAGGASIDMRVRVTAVPAQIADIRIAKFVLEYSENEYGD
jgi:hypothetical protein